MSVIEFPGKQTTKTERKLQPREATPTSVLTDIEHRSSVDQKGNILHWMVRRTWVKPPCFGVYILMNVTPVDNIGDAA
jgi:hypothetical protein